MPAVNLASKFDKYVDEAFAHESLIAGAVNENVDFTGVNEVSVYSIDPMPMYDYVRSGTSRFGTLEEITDRVQTFTIIKDRSFTGSIDEGNAQDQMNVKQAARLLRVQYRDVIIPEIDKYTLGVWGYGAGKVVGGAAPTASTIRRRILSGASFMNNNRVPRSGRKMFIKETYAAMLPMLSELTYLEGLGTQAIRENALPRVAGFDVKVVPDDDMPANIHFILQHKDACPFKQKLKTLRILSKTRGVDGNVVEGRVRYFAGVLGNKCAGVFVDALAANVHAKPTISITSGTATVTAAGATIYYTLDGSDPRYSKSRALIASGGTVTVPSGATIKAYAYTTSKYPSEVESATNN